MSLDVPHNYYYIHGMGVKSSFQVSKRIWNWRLQKTDKVSTYPKYSTRQKIAEVINIVLLKNFLSSKL